MLCGKLHDVGNSERVSQWKCFGQLRCHNPHRQRTIDQLLHEAVRGWNLEQSTRNAVPTLCSWSLLEFSQCNIMQWSVRSRHLRSARLICEQ